MHAGTTENSERHLTPSLTLNDWAVPCTFTPVTGFCPLTRCWRFDRVDMGACSLNCCPGHTGCLGLPSILLASHQKAAQPVSGDLLACRSAGLFSKCQVPGAQEATPRASVKCPDTESGVQIPVPPFPDPTVIPSAPCALHPPVTRTSVETPAGAGRRWEKFSGAGRRQQACP